MDEIDERRNFLQQMEKLGKGKQYRAQISMEISQVRRCENQTSPHVALYSFHSSASMLSLTPPLAPPPLTQRIRQLELIDQSKTAELHALEAKVKAATRPT